MGTRESWTALSARIRGLKEASVLTATLLPPGNDAYGAIVELRDHARAIVSDLLALERDMDQSLANAKQAIKRVNARVGPLLDKETADSQDTRQIKIRSALVSLVALEGEVAYLLRDSQERIHRLSERAFEHLRRSIVVDPGFRKKWETAYNGNEVQCEKLGSVHLLSHGIWAFKADANGRTDLVFGDLLTSIERIERVAEGLVLTEWKKLKPKEDPESKITQAMSQSRNYVAGVLGGIELSRYRYIVLVSKDHVPRIEDREINSVIYRYVNIPVSPSNPSKVKDL